jgi:hypothetical protein
MYETALIFAGLAIGFVLGANLDAITYMLFDYDDERPN